MRQIKADKNKIYSLREPYTECISKGKIHKRYKFGSNVSITTGKKSGIIYGAKNIEKNVYNGNTLHFALSQFKEINDYTPERVIADLGYRGIKHIDETRKEYRRRSSIEGKISHLNNDFKLKRNYYKGIFGDNINVILAAACSNFKRWINRYKKDIKKFLFYLYGTIQFVLFILPNKKFKYSLNKIF